MSRRHASNQIAPYLYLAPVLCLIGVLLVYPVVDGIVLSLRDQPAIGGGGAFVGLRNYVDLVRLPIFRTAVSNTLWWTLAVTTGEFILGLCLALLLARPIRGRAFFRTIILVPWIIPPAIAAVVWKWIYAEQGGILNHLLERLHILDGPVTWLSSPGLAMWSVIFVGVWKGTPFVAICLLAGLQAIPNGQYEAARVDGATAWQRLRFVTLPNLRSISLVVVILTTIWNVNQFAITHILTRGGPGHTTQILSTYAYQLFFTAFDLGHSAAVATVMLVIMMGLTGYYVSHTLRTAA